VSYCELFEASRITAVQQYKVRSVTNSMPFFERDEFNLIDELNLIRKPSNFEGFLMVTPLGLEPRTY
jgi:hypothetical protein